MKLSSRFATAIHTLLIISEYSKEHKVTSDTIAELINVSPITIRNLLGALKSAGFISAIPGKRKEGITLAQPLNAIKVLDVFCVVEPDCEKDVSDAHNHLASRVPTGQYLNEIISKQMVMAVDAAMSVLSNTTLADILTQLLAKEAESPHENPRALLGKQVSDDSDNHPDAGEHSNI